MRELFIWVMFLFRGEYKNFYRLNLVIILYKDGYKLEEKE